MRCPYCGTADEYNTVIDQTFKINRHKCAACGKSFASIELKEYSLEAIFVRKNNETKDKGDQ